MLHPELNFSTRGISVMLQITESSSVTRFCILYFFKRWNIPIWTISTAFLIELWYCKKTCTGINKVLWGPNVSRLQLLHCQNLCKMQLFPIMINESILQTHVTTQILNQEATLMALRAKKLFGIVKLLQETSATDVSHVIWIICSAINAAHVMWHTVQFLSLFSLLDWWSWSSNRCYTAGGFCIKTESGMMLVLEGKSSQMPHI